MTVRGSKILSIGCFEEKSERYDHLMIMGRLFCPEVMPTRTGVFVGGDSGLVPVRVASVIDTFEQAVVLQILS